MNTDQSIQPLVAQFVPLKVETQGEQWSSWSRKYPPAGRAIPLIYIIRADGEQVFGSSGGIAGPALPALLMQQLARAGTIYSPRQLTQLEDLTQKAQQALDKQDPSAALRILGSARRLGSPGSLGSFARVSRQADALFNKLVEQGHSNFTLAQEKIAGQETKFEGVLLLFQTEREFGAQPDLKAKLTKAVREVKRDESMKTVVKQVDVFNQAKVFAQSSRTKVRAVSWLQAIIAHFPDSQAAKYARDELDRMQAKAETSTASAENSPPGSTPPD